MEKFTGVMPALITPFDEEGRVGIDCGGPRRPLLPLDKKAEASLKKELEEIGFFNW